MRLPLALSTVRGPVGLIVAAALAGCQLLAGFESRAVDQRGGTDTRDARRRDVAADSADAGLDGAPDADGTDADTADAGADAIGDTAADWAGEGGDLGDEAGADLAPDSPTPDAPPGDSFPLRPAACSVENWCWRTWDVPQPHNNPIHAVWGNAHGIFAVGAFGTLAFSGDHGSSWQGFRAQTDHHLRGVWGKSLTDVWAVGDGGVLLHFDGEGWTSTTPAAQPLRAVWASDIEPFRAVGVGGTVLRLDGDEWTVESSGTTSANLEAIWGVGGEVWVVGRGGTALRHDSAWEVTTTDTTADLLAVSGRSTTEVYATGDATLYWDGTSWQAVAHPNDVRLHALRALGGSFVGCGDSGKVGRFDGANWTALVISVTAVDWWDLWPLGAGQALLLGQKDGAPAPGDKTQLALGRLQGDVVTTELPPADRITQVVAAHGTTPSAIFAITSHGLYAHDGAAAHAVPTAGVNYATIHFNDLWADGATVWIAGSGTRNAVHYPVVFRGDLTSFTAAYEDLNDDAGFTAIWADASGVVAVSSNGTLACSFDGADWDRYTGGTWQDVWGASITEVFLVDGSESVARFNGSSPPGPFPSPIGSWDRITGTSSSDLFVASTSTKAISAYSCAPSCAWTSPSFISDVTLAQISAAGAGEALLVGSEPAPGSSALVRFDGSSFTQHTTPAFLPLRSAFALGSDELIGVGDRGALWGIGP